MLRQRFITAVIAASVLGLVLFVLPELAAEVFIAAIIVAGAWEWSRFLAKGWSRGLYVIVIAALMAVVNLVFSADITRILLQVALVWWLLALLWAFAFPTPIPMMLRWLCGALVLVPLYAALVLLYQTDPWLLLFAMLLVWAADVGAFFAGKLFGRVKLAPKISPGKTWEGGRRRFVDRRRSDGEHVQANRGRKRQRQAVSRARRHVGSYRQSGRRCTAVRPRSRLDGAELVSCKAGRSAVYTSRSGGVQASPIRLETRELRLVDPVHSTMSCERSEDG